MVVAVVFMKTCKKGHHGHRFVHVSSRQTADHVRLWNTACIHFCRCHFTIWQYHALYALRSP